MGVRTVARPSEPREKSLSRVKVEASGPVYVARALPCASMLHADDAALGDVGCLRSGVAVNVRRPTEWSCWEAPRMEDDDGRNFESRDDLGTFLDTVWNRGAEDRILRAAMGLRTLPAISRGMTAKLAHCFSYTKKIERQNTQSTNKQKNSLDFDTTTKVSGIAVVPLLCIV